MKSKEEYSDLEDDEYSNIEKEDVYDDEYADSLLEDDEISSKEAAFMHGYNKKSFG